MKIRCLCVCVCVVGAYTHQPLCWSAVTEKPAASVPLPAALCSSSKKGPECTKPKVVLILPAVTCRWLKSSFCFRHETHHTLNGYLQEAVAAHCPVGGPIALVCGSVPEAVTPLFNHVEALGMPNVSLQPHVLPLPAVKLQQQISMPAAGLAALALWLLLLLLWTG